MGCCAPRSIRPGARTTRLTAGGSYLGLPVRGDATIDARDCSSSSGVTVAAGSGARGATAMRMRMPMRRRRSPRYRHRPSRAPAYVAVPRRCAASCIVLPAAGSPLYDRNAGLLAACRITVKPAPVRDGVAAGRRRSALSRCRCSRARRLHSTSLPPRAPPSITSHRQYGPARRRASTASSPQSVAAHHIPPPVSSPSSAGTLLPRDGVRGARRRPRRRRGR